MSVFLSGITNGVLYFDAGNGQYSGVPADEDSSVSDDGGFAAADDGTGEDQDLPSQLPNQGGPQESAQGPVGGVQAGGGGLKQNLKNRAADNLLSRASNKLNGPPEGAAPSVPPAPGHEKSADNTSSPRPSPASGGPAAAGQASPAVGGGAKIKGSPSGGGFAKNFARRGVTAAQDYRKAGGNANLKAAASVAGGVAKDMAKDKAKEVGAKLAQKAVGKVANKAAGQVTGVDVERSLKAGKSALGAAKSAASGDIGAAAANAAAAGVEAADVGLLFTFRQLYLNIEGGPAYPFQLIGAWVVGNALFMLDLIGLVGIGNGSGMSFLEKLVIFAADLLLFFITLGITVLIIAYGICGGISGWAVYFGSWVSSAAAQVQTLCKALGK